MQNKPVSERLREGLQSLFGAAVKSWQDEARVKFVLEHPEVLENAAKKQRTPAFRR